MTLKGFGPVFCIVRRNQRELQLRSYRCRKQQCGGFCVSVWCFLVINICNHGEHYETPCIFLGVTCASQSSDVREALVVIPVLYSRLCDSDKFIQLYFYCACILTVHVGDGRMKGWCSCMRSGQLVAGLRDICSNVADSNLYWKIRCRD
jgi:hypothetical protein